jgi:hypothetical protein
MADKFLGFEGDTFYFTRAGDLLVQDGKTNTLKEGAWAEKSIWLNTAK